MPILSFLICLVGALPLTLRSLFGRLLGTLFSFIPTRERRIAALHLFRFVPDAPAATIRRMYGSIGATFLESLNLAPFLAEYDRHIACSQWPEIEEWRGRGGIVCLTGHVGNWDLLAAAMIHRGMKLTVIGKEMRNPKVQALLDCLRSAYGVRTLWRGDRSAIAEIAKALKGREVVAALIDQDTAVSSVHSTFFGVPAKTPSALVAIAKKHECTLTTAFLVRTGFLRYEIIVKELDRSQSIEQILDAYHQELERIIRMHPEQWVWFHKRWRTPRDGDTLSSSRYLAWLKHDPFPSR